VFNTEYRWSLVQNNKALGLAEGHPLYAPSLKMLRDPDTVGMSAGGVQQEPRPLLKSGGQNESVTAVDALLPSLLHHKKKQMLLLASLSKSTENALKA
jgi:hypothetical protein